MPKFYTLTEYEYNEVLKFLQCAAYEVYKNGTPQMGAELDELIRGLKEKAEV